VNLAVVGGLPRTPENRVWFRLINLSYLKNALSSSHTKKTLARFNPGPLLTTANQFASLSLADDLIAAQFEAGAALGSYKPGHHISHPNLSLVTLNVQVTLREVIDLTDLNAQTALGTNVQELTGDWEGFQFRSNLTSVPHPTGIAPTQELGKALFATGVEGFRSVSAKCHFKRLWLFLRTILRSAALSFSPTTAMAASCTEFLENSQIRSLLARHVIPLL
jgi:hypothetical protein